MPARARAADEVVLCGRSQLLLAGDEAAPDRIIDLREQFGAGAVIKREAHLIRVQRRRDVAAQVDIGFRIEGDFRPVMERDALVPFDLFKGALRLVGVGLVRLEAEQSENGGFVRTMTDAGEGERAVQVDLHARRLRKRPGVARLFKEAPGNAHRSDRVRRRRPDADLENVENRKHPRSSRLFRCVFQRSRERLYIIERRPSMGDKVIGQRREQQ